MIRVDGNLGLNFLEGNPLVRRERQLGESLSAASDITEQRQSQEALQRQRLALEEADRQKNEFLAMLVDELHNPLAPLGSASDLLQCLLPKSSQARRPVDIIERQVTQITKLVDALVDISRITQPSRDASCWRGQRARSA